MKIQERKVLLACRCTLLAVICMVCGFLFINMEAKAETVRIGTVSGLSSGGLNFRDAAGTSGTSIIGTLYNGDNGTILAEQTVNGTVWYQMSINGTIGWASSQYVTVSTQDVPSAQDFEAHLTAQGFPESYKAQLRALHAQYPNWVFEAHHVNLTWDEVVKAENSNHRSLVYTGSISSWKSLEGNDYNWSTGVWAGYDTSSWVAASEGIIKYHLDPRNFLDSTYVFQFLKQSYDSNIDYSVGLQTMVANSFLAGSFMEEGVSKSYITTLIEAGKQSGVSPYTIAATLIQEQGRKGTSGLISGTYPGYEGYYNFYNIGAYESGNLGPIEMGLIYAQKTDAGTLRPWNTRTKAITGGSIKYGRDYVSIGQDTLYLKKFDLVPNASGGGLYNHQYMTNIQAAASEGKLLSEGYDASARAAALRFKIPVFKNMPSTAAVKPTENGKPYQLLQSISVTNGSLEPAYNIYCKTYTVLVPENATNTTINVTSKNPNAKVTGAGTIALKSDITKVTVTVAIPNVSSNTYTLNISKGIKGQWMQNSTGWWYQYIDGSYPVNAWEHIGNYWYYFDANGYMVTGWRAIGNTWYYFEASGAMATGWLNEGSATYYLNAKGEMVTGWQSIDGHQYLFNGSGVMQTGWKELNGKKCYLDVTGAMAIGWKDIQGNRYYFDANGYMLIGWHDIEGGRYLFDEKGVLISSIEGEWIKDKNGFWFKKLDGTYPINEWKQIGGDWYYFDANGYRVTGWKALDNKWYYMDSEGKMATGWLQDGSEIYYLGASGIMATGWKNIDGKRFFFQEGGAMATGWKEVNGEKCYLQETGVLGKKGAMAIGWYTIGDSRYYFNTDGYMQTGWLVLNGTKYYLKSTGILTIGWFDVDDVKYCSDKDGKVLIGWQTLGNKRYYFKEDGTMATDWIKSGTAWYYLQEDGTMAIGWHQIRGYWYYLQTNGVMATGWIKLGNTWYYLHSSGAMATGWLKVANKWYYFKESGAMVTGWLNDHGTWYYLDSSGAMVTNRYIDGYYVNSKGVWVP